MTQLIRYSTESLPEVQPVQQPDSTGAIALLTEQVSSLTQQLQQLWSHVENMNAQSPQTQSATDTSFFTYEIEGLRSQLMAVEQERDQAAAQLEQLRSENETLQLRFDQQQQAYQRRIEGLTELLKQSPSIGAIAPAQGERKEGAIAQSQPVHSPQPGQPRREHSTRAGSADQKVEAAMRAIMEWNRNRNYDNERFAITQSLLQKATGSNMPAVKRVMEAFKNEIHEHNTQYALDPDRHNYGRNFDEIKGFVQSKI